MGKLMKANDSQSRSIEVHTSSSVITLTERDFDLLMKRCQDCETEPLSDELLATAAKVRKTHEAVVSATKQ